REAGPQCLGGNEPRPRRGTLIFAKQIEGYTPQSRPSICQNRENSAHLESPSRSRVRCARVDYLTVKLFDTRTGLPVKAGTFALRNTEATHPPTEVPANGAPLTVAEVTRPLLAKVRVTFPVPVGPPDFLQLRACEAALLSAATAALRLNG